MTSNKISQMTTVAIVFMVMCAGAYAEKTVYKWVDENGVVHFSDAPPADADPANAETLIIPKSPPAPATAQSAASPATVSTTTDDKQAKQPRKEKSLAYEQIDISKMSLADLDSRCDEAREKAIAPLREAEIAKCKQDERNDPAWCDRFNADYGDGGRTGSGSIRPRMFDDLPECVEALQEKNRRR